MRSGWGWGSSSIPPSSGLVAVRYDWKRMLVREGRGSLGLICVIFLHPLFSFYLGCINSLKMSAVMRLLYGIINMNFYLKANFE